MSDKQPKSSKSHSQDGQIDALGFYYALPNFNLSKMSSSDVKRACFRAKKAFDQIIFDTVKLEGNPYTFPEVKTLLDGVTVGGHKPSDEMQILNQSASWKLLLKKVQEGSFHVNKNTFCELNNIAGAEEALMWGKFRDGTVNIAGTEHKPPGASQLNAVFSKGLDYINGIENPLEQAMVFFLFGSINQFFYDVNKRTSRLIANGILLSAGYDAINIPAKRQLEFNEKMIRFYDSKDGTEMLAFLATCSLDPSLSAG